MNARNTLATIALLSVLASGCGSGEGTPGGGTGAASTDATATTEAPVVESTDATATTEAPVVESDATATTEAPVVESTDATATTEAPVAEMPEPTCAYIGTDEDFGYMQVDLTFTNPLGEVNELEVTYALLDGDGGIRFFTGSAGGLDLEDVQFPAVNEQFRLSVDTREELPPTVEATTISCTVLAIEDGTSIGGFERATDSDTCVILGADSNGRIEVEGTATSPYEETTGVQTWVALYAPGPVRFETLTKVVDLVGAGEPFKVNPSFGAEAPEWIGDGEVTCAVVGFWDHGV